MTAGMVAPLTRGEELKTASFSLLGVPLTVLLRGRDMRIVLAVIGLILTPIEPNLASLTRRGLLHPLNLKPGPPQSSGQSEGLHGNVDGGNEAVRGWEMSSGVRGAVEPARDCLAARVYLARKET